MDRGFAAKPAVLDLDTNQNLFPDKAFQTRELAEAAIQDLGREGDFTVNVVKPKTRRERIAEAIAAIPTQIEMTLTITPEYDQFLESLAHRLGKTRGEAIHKGLILLQIALDAKEKGKRLVVVDDRQNSEEDVLEV